MRCASRVMIVAASLVGGAAGFMHEPPTPSPVGADPTAPHDDRAAACEAETVFFEALNFKPERRGAAIDLLWKAWRQNPDDGPTNLWLGLAYLWDAGEGETGSARKTESAIVAERMLARARRLIPEDDRIVSWLSAVRFRLAQNERDDAAKEAARIELRAACGRDPCFHAVALGILAFDRPRGSAEFAEGLAAMRRAAECAGGKASVENRARWPHNLEGFSLALAQYELKAGNRQRAETMLMSAQSRAGYADWPHKGLVEEQFAKLKEAMAKYADDDVGNDPPLAIGAGSAVSCRVCHQAMPK